MTYSSCAALAMSTLRTVLVAPLGWLGAHGVGVHGAHVVGRGNRVTAVWTADVTWRIPLPIGHRVLDETGVP